MGRVRMSASGINIRMSMSCGHSSAVRRQSVRASGLPRSRTVEPHGSQEPTPPAPDSIESTALVLADTAVPQRPRGVAPQWLLLAGIGGAIVSLVLAIGISRAEQDAPADAPPPVVATPPPPAVTEIESTPPPTWAGSRRTGWAQDGSKTIDFTLAATRDVPVWMSRARPALVIRCLYRRTEAFVALDTSTTYEDDADRRTVTLQWDDDSASTQRWALSESGKELFAPDGIAVVRHLATARRLRFGFSPFNAAPVTAEFAVEGFDELAGLVARTCGWRLDERLARTE